MVKLNRKKSFLSQVGYCYSLHEQRVGATFKTCNKKTVHCINRKKIRTIFIKNEEIKVLREEIIRDIQSLRNTFGEY